MAAPSKTVPHPGRALVLLLVLIVAMLLGILGPKLFAPSQWEHRFKVGLGLDLSSGTQVTMQAPTLTGEAPSTDEMNAAIGVISRGSTAPATPARRSSRRAPNLIVVTVPGKGSQQTIELVSTTALLMFRQVLLYEPYAGAASTPAPAASPSASASPSAVGAGEPLGDGDAARQRHQHGKTSAKIVPAASASATADAPAASASGRPAPAASASAAPQPQRQPELRPRAARVSATRAWCNKDMLALFNKLVCKPGDTQEWKKQVGYTRPSDYNNPDVQIVACGSSGNGQVRAGRGQGAGHRGHRAPPPGCPRPPTSGRST